MPATRVGDSTSGICSVGLRCCPHGRSGVNSQGSPNVMVNEQPVHRMSDMGSCNCPHGGAFRSTGASKTVRANFLGITRIGDSTNCQSCGCPGCHTSGSSNVIVGG